MQAVAPSTKCTHWGYFYPCGVDICVCVSSEYGMQWKCFARYVCNNSKLCTEHVL